MAKQWKISSGPRSRPCQVKPMSSVAMEALRLVIYLPREQDEEPTIEELRQSKKESAIKKGQEGRVLCASNKSDEQQGSGRTAPPQGQQLWQGAAGVQSTCADVGLENVDSDDSTEPRLPRKRYQRRPRQATLKEEPLPSAPAGTGYSLRARSGPTLPAKDWNGDHYNQLVSSEDDPESCGGERLGNAAEPALDWRCRKRRTVRRGSSGASALATSFPTSKRATESSKDGVAVRIRKLAVAKSQVGFTKWLREKRPGTSEPAAGPRAPLRQDGITASSDGQHPRRSRREEHFVAARGSLATPRSSPPAAVERRRSSSCEPERAARTVMAQRAPGLEASATTRTKPPIRKRKAAPLANESSDAIRPDSWSNHQPRSGRAVQQHIDARTPPPSPSDLTNASMPGTCGRRPHRLCGSEENVAGEVSWAGTTAHEARVGWGRESWPPATMDDYGARSGSHSDGGHFGLVGGGFGTGSEPSSTDSPGAAAQLTSDDEYRPSPGRRSDCHRETHNAGTPIATRSYPIKSRRRLPFGIDSRAGAPLSPAGNPERPPPNTSPALRPDSIQGNQHASSRTGGVPPTDDDAGVANSEGHQDDEEWNEDDDEGEPRLWDLNELPDQQKRGRKISRARKKHRPKVFREGRLDRRRKPQNAAKGAPKTKAREANRKPGGRKKRETSELKSAQEDVTGKQGLNFLPEAEIHGPARAFGHTSFFPDVHDWAGLLVPSAYEPPRPSRKRRSDDDRVAVSESPRRREIFKSARRKSNQSQSDKGSGLGEQSRESSKHATIHGSAVAAAQTRGQAVPRIRANANNSLPLVESRELPMRMALWEPATEVAGEELSIDSIPFDSGEGVWGESSRISREPDLSKGSVASPGESLANANSGRIREGARAHARTPPNTLPKAKRVYVRRKTSTPKQTDTAGLLDLVVNGMTNMDLEETDPGLQLVPHVNQNRAMVPFMLVRRKKPRARVMLDGEDKRVWRLLMTQGTSFEADSSGKEGPRQWEEERATMKARAEKFINRMHLVQGDRRFSVWKGSVVDSVVGAFLTQNVSDHLSSSAFMCLASRFPVARKKKAAAEPAHEAIITEVKVEETFDMCLEASGIPRFSDGPEGVQEARVAVYGAEEVCGTPTYSDGPELGLEEQLTVSVEEGACDISYGTPTLSDGAEVVEEERGTDFHGEDSCDSSKKSSPAEEGSSEATVTEVQVEETDENGPQRSGNPSFRCDAEAQEERTTDFLVEGACEKSSATGEVLSDATVTEVQVEETYEHRPQASGIRFFGDGAEDVQEERETDFHAEEARQVSEKSSATGAGSFICCNQQADDALSTKLEHSERGTGLTLESTSERHTGAWLIDLREQNCSCSSKSSKNQYVSCLPNAASRAGDSLEFRNRKEQESRGVASLSSGIGHLNCNYSTAEDVGKRDVTTFAVAEHQSVTQSDPKEVGAPSIYVELNLGAPADDRVAGSATRVEAIPKNLHKPANNLKAHEMGENSIPREENFLISLSSSHIMACAASEEIAASSCSVVSSSNSLDADKRSQSSAIPGSDSGLVIGERIETHPAGVIFSVASVDTNKVYDQQLVWSLETETSEYWHQQLKLLFEKGSSRLRTLKNLLRKPAEPDKKGPRKPGPRSRNGMNNSELVSSTGADQEKGAPDRKKRPVLSLTGIDRARLEQSNITSKVEFDWEAVRLKYTGPETGESRHESAHAGSKSFGSSDVENGVDWDAVKLAKVEDIAAVIKERGMNNVLAGRIKAFLERVQKEHGSVDLEWLRTVSVEEAKSFLLSVRGLGLKSVECIRLLTLHHLAFPVDTNVGRICVRLGWVPLEPLPEELQLHLLEMYPVQETIQKYLWPRLCTLDQRTLYELHYQMITFGKVFCTKSRPNCNACPMRDDCQHFASALASTRLALPAAAHEGSHPTMSEPLALPAAAASFTEKVKLALPLLEQDGTVTGEELSQSKFSTLSPKPCEPIIEEPRTPEREIEDIEDFDTFAGIRSLASGSVKGPSSDVEIQTIPVCASKALVLLPPNTASIPVPKLKNVGRLRTVHYVYELPDSHPLVQEMDAREDDDPCFYLLAIWSPGESLQAPPVLDDMYTNGTCDGFNSSDEETVKGTVLVPCRTAMRGIFPLNGTYFQVNEVFADHTSSLQPIEVPRTLLWNLRRRFVYFGTSVTTIFKGLSTEEIQACFWRGYVCVRGFDSVSRCPRPLAARLHFPASKMLKSQKGEPVTPPNDEN